MDKESIKLLLKEAYFEGFEDNASNVTWANVEETWENSVIKSICDNPEHWLSLCEHNYIDTSSFYESYRIWKCTKCSHTKRLY